MSEKQTVGLVKTKYADLGNLKLECGESIPVTLAYETYGTLNEDKNNAVLVCHALSGDAHAAGKHHSHEKKQGWYDIAIGPGKTFDTNKLFVISSNILGGCKGSTGPSSLNPKTGKPYGLKFPQITVKDIVAAQKKLVESLGIEKLFCVTGGSLGGMQALQWVVDYPKDVAKAVILASAAKQYPLGIAFHEVGRQAILNDPKWNNGNYKKQPQSGLSVARQLAHITYLSQDLLQRKFNRDLKEGESKGKFGVKYEVESYLHYKGRHFVRRFDANSYLYITKAIDDFDLTQNGKIKLSELFKGIKTKVLIGSFTSDWLYPPEHGEEIVAGLAEAGVPVVYKKLDLPYGHDSFLVYNNTLGNTLTDFIEEEWEEYQKN
jgi:homoserine O-acetyltransferase